jgi:hypothetical protein
MRINTEERIAAALERIAGVLERAYPLSLQVPPGVPVVSLQADPQPTWFPDDFLAEIPQRVWEAWNTAYGAELVRAELPKARAGWLSDAVKQRTGNKAVYIRHWLQNALKTQKNAALRGPHAEFDIGQVIREREAQRAKEGV